MNNSRKSVWNPYIAGSLTGVLIIVSAALTGDYFGTSTAVVQLTGIIENLFSPSKVSHIKYFSIIRPVLSWQTMFVLGILGGSFAAAKMHGDFNYRLIPDLWQENLGSSNLKRSLFAYLGGIISMFGARLTGGCPSGQMSSSILLSVNGFASLTIFFIVGIITARIIHNGGVH